MKKKCEYLEEEVEKEKLINKNNKKLIEDQIKIIEEFKNEANSANERTKSENNKVIEKDEELKKLKVTINDEILINENNKKTITDLNDKVRKLTEEKTKETLPSSDVCEHEDEIKKMKGMIEKAKELRNTSDLRIKKLKEQHTEEINEVKVQNLKLQEELGNVVKERQRLKESERILVQTFDTLKMYYEKPENMAQCSQCGLTCASESELKKHKLSSHTQVFACISCAYESNDRSEYENHARTHIPSTGISM